MARSLCYPATLGPCVMASTGKAVARSSGSSFDGLSVSHACDTICHRPSFLTSSSISTPRFKCC